MTYLIDGYNLLHAIGLASRNQPAKAFERARTRLLDWLADRMVGRSDVVRVVFDAQKSPSPSAESEHRGVKVRFAHGQTADELIEELLRADRQPSKITVVSNDGQVQDAGRHRGSAVFTCQEFVDWLIAEPARNSAAPSESPREESASPEEMAAWLDAFSQPKKPRKK